MVMTPLLGVRGRPARLRLRGGDRSLHIGRSLLHGQTADRHPLLRQRAPDYSVRRPAASSSSAKGLGCARRRWSQLSRRSGASHYVYQGRRWRVLLSHLPGFPTVAGAAMGIAALCVTMLRLPLTSGHARPHAVPRVQGRHRGDAGTVIVAAVVAFVMSTRLNPPPVPRRPNDRKPVPRRSAAPCWHGACDRLSRAGSDCGQ